MMNTYSHLFSSPDGLARMRAALEPIAKRLVATGARRTAKAMMKVYDKTVGRLPRVPHADSTARAMISVYERARGN